MYWTSFYSCDDFWCISHYLYVNVPFRQLFIHLWHLKHFFIGFSYTPFINIHNVLIFSIQIVELLAMPINFYIYSQNEFFNLHNLAVSHRKLTNNVSISSITDGSLLCSLFDLPCCIKFCKKEAFLTQTYSTSEWYS